jgi:L-ribulose-5-phosphate 4-epimerase
MLLELLRQEVLDANLELVRQGLVFSTFGNASGIARDQGLVVIKPSGVSYETLRAADLVITDLDGNRVEGSLNPSSDLATHLVLYRAFPQIGGVAHTHARHSTAWAQAGREIPCFGTTHADYVYGPVPITEPMQACEIESNYEANTGEVIVRRFAGLDPASIPTVLVHGHGPFCWGSTPAAAVKAAVMVEEIARIACWTVAVNPLASPISQALLDQHFLRKHGPKAYYGQK